MKIRRNLAFAFVREQEAHLLSLSSAPEMTDNMREDLLKSFEPVFKAFWQAMWPVAKATVEDQLAELQSLCEAHDERALKAEAERDEALKDAEAARTSEASMKDKLIKAFQDRDKALAEGAESRMKAIKAEGALEALKSAHEQELERLKQLYETKKK